VSDDVREFAMILLRLEKIAEADGYELYVPGPIEPTRPRRPVFRQP